MTCARKALVCLKDTPYYHVIARCVRRAWLWGFDEYAGKDYSHRKVWVLERLTRLSSIFAVDLCAYAIMSNHYHLVVHVDQRRAKSWLPQEVVERWCKLFSKPALVDRWQQGLCSDAEREVAEGIVELWRRRLCDVSWYMRCLNEHLARRANAEDQCTGRFWEGRFKSQALLDEAGLLTAMAYVDLNPIRAGIAETPETSEFTSIYERIRQLKPDSDVSAPEVAKPPLLGFQTPNVKSEEETRSIPFSEAEYLELVDWTGRAQRPDKRGAIDARQPAIMRRLNLDKDVWRNAMQAGGNVFGRAIGQINHLRLHAAALDQSWIRGSGRARRLFG
jgi:REP element-mobilizing transposase RayT